MLSFKQFLVEAVSKSSLADSLIAFLSKHSYVAEKRIKAGSVMVVVRSDEGVSRKEMIHEVYDFMKKTKSIFTAFDFKENVPSKSRQGTFKVRGEAVSPFVDVVCKEGDQRRGSALKAVDFLSLAPSKEIDCGSFGVVDCYYFTNAKKMATAVINSCEQSSKFTETQKEIIRDMFSQGTLSPGAEDEFQVEAIKNEPGLMVAFGEIYVPWLFLSKRINKVEGVKDFNGKNVTQVALPKFDMNKIDCIVTYTGRKPGKNIYFSAKFGQGHDPSLIPLMADESINWKDYDKDLAGISELYKNNKWGILKAMDVYYMTKSKCFTSPEDMFKSILGKSSNWTPKNPLKGFTKQEVQELENFREKFCKNSKRKYGISFPIEAQVNYPFSLSRFFAAVTKERFEKPEVKKLILDKVLGGGYYQYRINIAAIKKGKLKFDITAVKPSSHADIIFLLSSGYNDFKLSSGSHFVGYSIV